MLYEVITYFQTGYYLLVRGKIQPRTYNPSELEFKIKDIHLLSSVREDLITSLTLKVKTDDITPEFITELKEIITENSGKKTLRNNFV